MSKRSVHMQVFKLEGIWWEHRKYCRNGEWRHCYAPKHSYDPIFSKKPLNVTDIKAYVKKEKEKHRGRVQPA